MSAILLLLAACDNSGESYRPKVTGIPAVVDLGELPVISTDERQSGDFDPLTSPGVVYGQLGAPENPGAVGGASLQFTGTGGCVQIVVDPEAVFWSRDMTPNPTASDFKYEDNYADDGDLDLLGGLTAYYTGTPGQEIGDFTAVYTDEQGVDHQLPFNECERSGYGGVPDAHDGRATVETCVIDTAERAGVKFTVLLRTFSLPIDDSVLNYAVGVFETAKRRGVCEPFNADECFFQDEVNLAGAAPDSNVDHSYFAELEAAYCDGAKELNEYCEAGFESGDSPCTDPNDVGY